MTTQIVPSITDEQLAALEMHAELSLPNERQCVATFGELRGLIARLRAAEKDADRYRLFSRMSEQLSQGVWLKGPERFLFESMNSVEKVTEQDLASMFDTAMEQSK